jgi:hypothetical protein
MSLLSERKYIVPIAPTTLVKKLDTSPQFVKNVSGIRFQVTIDLICTESIENRGGHKWEIDVQHVRDQLWIRVHGVGCAIIEVDAPIVRALRLIVRDPRHTNFRFVLKCPAPRPCARTVTEK